MSVELPWVPYLHPTIQSRLEQAEARLSAGEASAAESALAGIYEILEEDDPVNPSFVKAYVRSRWALARAHQGKTEAVGEILGCRDYLQEWDAPDGLHLMSVCLVTGQVRRLLGDLEGARQDFENLYTQLKEANRPGQTSARLPGEVALLRATAAELAGLGFPRPADEIPAEVPVPRPPSPPNLVDFKFFPRFPERLHMGPVAYQGGTYSAGDGSAAWFDPRSQDDLRILLRQPRALLETDDPQVLARIGEAQYHPHHHFVLYQPWREPLEDGRKRLLGAMVPSMAGPVGECLRQSPVRHLFLITGGIFKGALGALKEGLGGHRLETLGLVWHFTGDDITDVPTMADEIADLCAACGNQKLSLITGAWSKSVEKQLVGRFADLPELKVCSAFEKDDRARYPRFKTPGLDGLLSRRGAE